MRIAAVFFSKLRGKNESKYSLKSLTCHDEILMVQTANIGQYRSFNKRYRSSNFFTFHPQLVIFVIVTTDLFL